MASFLNISCRLLLTYSLDVFSLFHRIFLKYRIKNIWSPPGIEPRTACLTHKHSATELWLLILVVKIYYQFIIYLPYYIKTKIYILTEKSWSLKVSRKNSTAALSTLALLVFSGSPSDSLIKLHSIALWNTLSFSTIPFTNFLPCLLSIFSSRSVLFRLSRTKNASSCKNWISCLGLRMPV